jgi:hypothetical protein
MSNRILYIIIGFAVVFGILAIIMNRLTPVADAPTEIPTQTATTTEEVFCTADAMQCPDGSYVGRTGSKCEFVCPQAPTVPADVQAHIDSKADMIKVISPAPMSLVQNPIQLSGQARGGWLFEAVAPVTLVDWDGKIVAEGYVTAQGDWMTAEFVPFAGTLEFTSPYKAGDPDTMKKGTLIFKKDNPSGLPENDDAVEIPVVFAN